MELKTFLGLASLTCFLFLLQTASANHADIADKVEEETESKVERSHVVDSQVLLMFIGLLIATVLTIWLFKVKKFRYMHESGLSTIYGKIFASVGVHSSFYGVNHMINFAN